MSAHPRISSSAATLPTAISQDDTAAIPAWKRGLDIVVSSLAILLLAPVILVVTLITWCGSPGPVLFRQERVGLRGRRFTCYKFRTMKAGASTTVHAAHLERLITSNLPMEKMDSKGDARLIPMGRWIRASGLDELPQIINVLRGEMSLVGPRPCLPYEYELYQPWQKERFSTLPGLTGLWQVSGKNKTTFDQMIRLDIHYARSKTLWLDAKIIMKTVPTLVGQVLESRRRRHLTAGRERRGYSAAITYRRQRLQNSLPSDIQIQGDLS